MSKRVGDIPILMWAAHSYLDWFWYIEHRDGEGAESSYSDYQFFKRQIMEEMMADKPAMSELDIEAYVTGMIDGYIEAVTNE